MTLLASLEELTHCFGLILSPFSLFQTDFNANHFITIFFGVFFPFFFFQQQLNQ